MVLKLENRYFPLKCGYKADVAFPNCINSFINRDLPSAHLQYLKSPVSLKVRASCSPIDLWWDMLLVTFPVGIVAVPRSWGAEVETVHM